MSDDKEIFQKAMQGVKPLKSNQSIPGVKFKPVSQTTKAEIAPDIPVVSNNYFVEDVTRLEFKKNGIQNKAFRRLKRGEFGFSKELDLHGLNIEKARKKVLEFIISSADQGLKVVLIIHGKGGRKGGKPGILKTRVNVWLRQIDKVLAFCPAQNKDGGSGAVYVLLKSRTRDE